MKSLSVVRIQPERACRTTLPEYGVRFLFGGLITAVVGIVGKVWGPGVAGLFLAFPAILPASSTLIAKHDGVRAAGADALGATVGSVGLLAFGAAIWLGATNADGGLILGAALAVWLAVSVSLWLIIVSFQRAKHG